MNELEIERAVPHSIEAERATLGAILMREQHLPAVMTALAPEDFFRAAHRRIYAAILAMRAAGTPVDLLLLKDLLQRDGDLDEIGGPAYLAALLDGVPSSANAEQYANVVREKSRLRNAIAAANRLIEAAYSEEDAAVRLVERATTDLLASLGTAQRGAVLAQDAVRAYAFGLDTNSQQAPVLTGYADLDALVGGFRRGNLVIVAGRPSSGKSSFGLGLAQRMATAGEPTAFFSLEMTEAELAARLLAWRSGVPSSRLERKIASEADYAAVAAALEHDGGVLRLECSARSVAEVGAWCQRFRADGGLTCAVVDFLQLLVPSRQRESRETEVALIGQALKDLAKAQDVIVVALAQLSRAPEARKDKRPTPADLRESGSLEQVADLVLLVFRPEMYTPTPENAGLAELIVAKARTGPTGVIRLQFTNELAMFRDLAHGE